jgi:hypothetical protein
MNRRLAMPVAQNAPIGMGLLCPSDSVGNDAMDMGVVVDRKGFVSRSKEENAAAATLERAAAAKYLSYFVLHFEFRAKAGPLSIQALTPPENVWTK